MIMPNEQKELIYERDRDETNDDYHDPTDKHPGAQQTTMTTSTIMKQTCAKIRSGWFHKAKWSIYQNNDGDCNYTNTTALLASIPTIQIETMAGIVWQLKKYEK